MNLQSRIPHTCRCPFLTPHGNNTSWVKLFSLSCLVLSLFLTVLTSSYWSLVYKLRSCAVLLVNGWSSTLQVRVLKNWWTRWVPNFGGRRAGTFFNFDETESIIYPQTFQPNSTNLSKLTQKTILAVHRILTNNHELINHLENIPKTSYEA